MDLSSKGSHDAQWRQQHKQHNHVVAPHSLAKGRAAPGERRRGRLDGTKGGRTPSLALRWRVRRNASADPEETETSSVEVCEDICSTEDFGIDEEASTKKDLTSAIGVGGLITILVSILSSDFVVDHKDLALSAVFVVGYLGIILEESLAFNKSGVGLIMAVSLWTIRMLGDGDAGAVIENLNEHVADTSEIIFFLMGAMTIVEIVDSHQGFKLVTKAINAKSNESLLWIISMITFFMSAILDNLTSTIVMVSLLRKLVKNPERRKLFGSAIVLAANAGGAWTPIGDVTTTMLWINGNISTLSTMSSIFLPSLVSLMVPVALMGRLAPEIQGDADPIEEETTDLAPRGKLVFATGVGALLFVPVFKSLTGLPPYLGMLSGLGVLWLLTDVIHYGEDDRTKLRVPYALSRIDTQGVLFFLGILLSIAALDSAGLLKDIALFLDNHIPNVDIIAATIGVVSAIIDNVPLVAATMGMYDITNFPKDAELWQLIAYCAGTGGSILIIGSAAGVAFMGMEKADFGWYFRKVTPWAFAGYVAGLSVYLAQSKLPAVFASLPLLESPSSL
ncbi:solute carrier protein [Chloropicon primus]|uniref:Solute carrier protein n=1 Tax=Chloropicon primus TaxID=1764295 RepID=A0A5B8MQ63_9CHLO|nr:solute carrier protein [Chloropicon primus]UPR01883.1 solute carrier protein [Chloropicon primus]|eukprot:QDZ22659.1 solute carrier protein [Chloropicon primus]